MGLLQNQHTVPTMYGAWGGEGDYHTVPTKRSVHGKCAVP